MHHFSAIISKVPEFVQNRVFSPRSARFLIAALSTLLFSHFQQSAGALVQNGFFSPRSGRFVIFALDALLFSHF